MIEAFSGIAGAIGLSTSAGLNAYLPLLVVGLAARSTGLIQLNGPWVVLTNGWVLAILAVLLLIEMTVDKIPAVDTLNDGIQTVGRPLAGAILFAAGSGAAGEIHPVPAFIAGLLIAGGVHAAKTIARPVVTVVTGGMGNWPGQFTGRCTVVHHHCRGNSRAAAGPAPDCGGDTFLCRELESPERKNLIFPFFFRQGCSNRLPELQRFT